MIEKFTGIILAGGESKRMGYKDKPLLKIQGKRLIDIIYEKLSSLFKQVIIVCSEKNYKNLKDLPVTVDIIPSCGPLGGIYTGLIKSNNFYNFITACDMPNITIELIKYLCDLSTGYDIIIPETDKLEPLCAIYSKNCISVIKKRIDNKNFKITSILNELNYKIVKIGNEFMNVKKMFKNINYLYQSKK